MAGSSSFADPANSSSPGQPSVLLNPAVASSPASSLLGPSSSVGSFSELQQGQQPQQQQQQHQHQHQQQQLLQSSGLSSIAAQYGAAPNTPVSPSVEISTDRPIFAAGALRSESPQSVSRSLGSGVRDQIHVFRLTQSSSLSSSPNSNGGSGSPTANSNGLEQNLHASGKVGRSSSTRRTVQACERCHKRRTKCDGKYPECSACVKASVKCQYASNRSGAMLYPRGYVSALEDRIAWLEQSVSRSFPGLTISEIRTGSELDFSLPSATTELAMNHSSQADSSSSESDNHSPSTFRVGPEHYYYEAFKNPIETIDELAIHVGFLSLGSAAEQSAVADAPGEPRFIGSSSGLGIASNVNVMLRELGLRPKTPSIAEMRKQYTKGFESMDKSGEQGVNQNDPTMPPATADPSFFPPFEEALELARDGFQEMIFYSIINSSTFRIYLQKSYDPAFMDQLRRVPAWRLTLFLICAIGCASRGQHEKQKRYFIQALPDLNMTLMRDNIRSLRVLLLLSVYSMLDPEGASAWLCVGNACRIAVAMGLHRQSSVHNLNLINQEMRKRVFWTIYSLDRELSCMLGRPLSIQDRDIDVQYFLGLSSDPDLTGTTTVSTDPTAHVTLADVPIALHMVRLRRITTRILTSVQNSMIRPPGVGNEALLVDIHRELDLWKSTQPPIMMEPERTGIRIEIEYHEHLMLLYRQSPAYPRPSGNAALVCLTSARETIDLYAKLQRAFAYPPTFLGMKRLFMSGLTLVWAYFTCQRHNIWLYSTRVVISWVQTALEGLLRGAKVWPFGEQCAEALNYFTVVLEQMERESIAFASESSGVGSAGTTGDQQQQQQHSQLGQQGQQGQQEQQQQQHKQERQFLGGIVKDEQTEGGDRDRIGIGSTATRDVEEMLRDVPFDLRSFSGLLTGRELPLFARVPKASSEDDGSAVSGAGGPARGKNGLTTARAGSTGTGSAGYEEGGFEQSSASSASSSTILTRNNTSTSTHSNSNSNSN
ncbi:fungal-specific transcription factor domain-containing protein, partial [Lipomyces oligophaga]|uniref:fungal-specific transcription factor domain-containing protein n=1 Tax=Lipomyces oligophaga TaxID=45792 RepID=UPI0034CEB856